MVILWSLLQSLKEEKDVFTIRAWKLNVSSCCFMCNQGGWRRARGSFTTCARADTQFRLPEAHCCHRIYLTVGVKRRSMPRAGSECCDNAFSELQRCRGSPGRGRCRRSVGVSFLPVLSLGGCSMLSGMERIASYPEQEMWLQKWNKFLIVMLSSLGFWTSSLLLSLNHLCWPLQFSFVSCEYFGHPALVSVNTNLPFKNRKHSFP